MWDHKRRREVRVSTPATPSATATATAAAAAAVLHVRRLLRNVLAVVARLLPHLQVRAVRAEGLAEGGGVAVQAAGADVGDQGVHGV